MTNSVFDHIDINEYIVPQLNEPDIVFDGRKIAFIHSRNDSSKPRWTELTLFQTQGGSYVCVEAGVTTVDGEHTRYKASIVDTLAQVREVFGYGPLAKGLYDIIGMDYQRRLA